MITPMAPEMVDPIDARLTVLSALASGAWAAAAGAVGPRAKTFVALLEEQTVSTEASIRAAAAEAIAAGGGTILIVGDETTPISISSPLPVASGLTYMGSKTPSWVELSASLSTGTVLVGNGVIGVSPGTFDCFAFNTIDSATIPYANPAELWADTVRGFCLHNLVLRSFKTGVRFGALHRNGVHSPVIDKVIAEHCDTGFWFENCMQHKFGHLAYSCPKTLGYFEGSSMEDLWHHGNGVTEHIYGQNGGGMSDRHTRGIIIGPRGGGLTQYNNTTVLNLQHNGIRPSEYTQASAPVITSGSPDIAITSNISMFGVDEVVRFGSSVGGLSPDIPYFIQSKVDNGDGTGTIRVNTWEQAGSAFTPNASGSTSISVAGATGIRIGGVGPWFQYLTYSRFPFIDSEANGGAGVVVQRVHGCYMETSIITGTAATLQLIVTSQENNNQYTCRYPHSNVYVGIDGIQFLGYDFMSNFGGPSARKNRRQGLVCDGSSQKLFLLGNRRDTGSMIAAQGDVFGSDPSGFNAVGFGLPLRYFHGQAASGATLNQYSGGLITYTGAAGGNMTLPAITANMTGVSLEIVNPTGGALTLNPSSGQQINGASSFNASAYITQLRACTSDGTAFFWAAK